MARSEQDSHVGIPKVFNESMQPPVIPENEAARLQALRECVILDTPPEERFDRLTRLTQKLLGAQIAMVSLVDADRQWFKSRQGLKDISETGRDVSFCGHAILGDAIFQIPDASQDPRFADNPTVTGPLNIRFYAGAPLSTADGYYVGTLCIIDNKPRCLNDEELATLRDLADCVEVEINLHRQERQQGALRTLTQISSLTTSDPKALLREALGIACEHLRMPFGIVSHIQNDDYEIQVQVSPPDTLYDDQHFPLGHTYCSITLHADDVLPIAHMAQSEYAGHPCYQSFGLESYIGVPLHLDGAPYGTLNFSSPEPRTPRYFTEADVEFVRLLGKWTANTLQRWLLDRALQEHQHQLQESENKYRTLFDLSEDANMTLDESGFIDCNQATLAMFGYNSKTEFINKHPGDISPPQQPDGSESNAAALVQIKKAYKDGHNMFEWIHRRKNGDTFPAEVLLTPMALGGRMLLQAIVRDITERKQAEQALKHERDQAQRYLDTVQVMMVSLDSAGRIAMINRKGCELLGYKETELVGQNWFEKCLPAPENMEKVYPVFRMIMTGEIEAAEYYENQVICRDGRARLIAWHNAYLRGENGSIVGTLSSGEDITERRQHEQVLRTQATIIDQIHDSVVSTDLDGIITSWNRGAQHLFGYTSQEVIGKHMSTVYPDAENHMLQNRNIPALLKKGGYDAEVRMLRKSGQDFYAHVSLSLLYDESGEATGMIGYYIDITERMQAEAALKESESRLSFLLSSSPVVIYTCAATPPFGATYISPNIRQLMDYAPEQFTDNSSFWLSNIHPDDRQYVIDNLALLFEHGTHQHEYRFRMENGAYRWMHDELKLIYNEAGEPIEIIGFWQDISERKRVERMKSEFISTVSHELRTPLTSIIGSLGLISGNALGEIPERTRDMIRIANENSQRLSHLINDLLDMEKLAVGKMPLHMQPEPLMPLVEQAVRDNRSYAEQHHVRFEISKRVDNIIVETDSHRLQQVLTNLLSNAAKFSPRDDIVRIAVRLRDNIVRVEIIDNGPGIPAVFRDRVFEKFSQADASNTRNTGGTGLGLAICKELISRMGGEIGFESTEGEGATFFFELPVLHHP